MQKLSRAVSQVEAMTTIERIDQLSKERSRLFSTAVDSRRGNQESTQRTKEIMAELDQLWDLRRRERVGKLDGIDLRVERSYAKVYGDNYRDAVAPTAVEEAQETIALVA